MSEPADQRSRGSTGRTSPPSSGRVKGNQATYLFSPLFTSLILMLISSLSASLIPGLAVVEIHSINQTVSSKAWSGVVKLGGVGMCIEEFENFTSTCVPYSLFGNNDRNLADLPAGVLLLGIDPSPSDNTYKIINLVAHILASSAGIMAIIMVYGAVEEYRARGRQAMLYTRRAWHANSACLLINTVPFGLDVALIPKASAAVNRANQTQIGKIVPGATIYMSAAALLFNFTTFLVWLFWARRQPVPRWIQSDFIVDPKLPSPESFIAAGSMVETGTQPAFDNSSYPDFPSGLMGHQNQVSPMLTSEYPQRYLGQGWDERAPVLGPNAPLQAPQGLAAQNHAV